MLLWSSSFCGEAACHALLQQNIRSIACPPDAPEHDRNSLALHPCLPPAGRNGLKWTADLASIDLHYYLPIFVDGLLETQAGAQGVQGVNRRHAQQRLLEWLAPSRLLPLQHLHRV